MSHVRQQVRDAFKMRLTGIAGVQKIVGARAHAFDQSELPALQVITPDEAIEPLDDDAVETMRRINVDVTVFALGDDGEDDLVDTISAEVETLVLTATGAPWDSFVLYFPRSAELRIGGPAEQTLLMLRTRFRVEFSASDPETIGD